MKKRLAVSLAILAVLLASSPADADRLSGDGKIGSEPPQLEVGLRVMVPGVGGSESETYAADDPRAPRPFYTRAIPATSGAGAPGLSNLCFAPGGPTDPQYALGNGWWYTVELFVTATGADRGPVAEICVPFAAGAATDAPPAAPVVPQPPTIGEIWRAVALAEPPLGVSPDGRGVTGLPTWVWTANAVPTTVAVTLDGYTISGTARVAGYAMFSGEGPWERSRVPGSADEPAVTHTYEKTGTYRVGVATIWTAAAQVTGPGITTPITIDLGTAIVTNGIDYPVVQVRSRLLP